MHCAWPYSTMQLSADEEEKELFLYGAAIDLIVARDHGTHIRQQWVQPKGTLQIIGIYFQVVNFAKLLNPGQFGCYRIARTALARLRKQQVTMTKAKPALSAPLSPPPPKKARPIKLPAGNLPQSSSAYREVSVDAVTGARSFAKTTAQMAAVPGMPKASPRPLPPPAAIPLPVRRSPRSESSSGTSKRRPSRSLSEPGEKERTRRRRGSS